MKKILLFASLAVAVAFGCSDNGGDGATSDGTDSGTSTDTDASSDSAADATVIQKDCTTETTNPAQVACAANNFLATLTTAELAVAKLEFTDSKARTVWSNLPGVTRNGIKTGAMTATTKAAALALAKTVLTTQGYDHMIGVFAGDDYLSSLSGSGGGGGGGGGAPEGGMGGGGGPPDGGMGGGGMGGEGGATGGSTYSSDNYSFAILGTPSVTTDWMLQIGGHHMAYNITYKAGVGYPVPHHLGVEPKAQFTITGNYAGTYQPLEDKGAAMFAMFTAFDAAQLQTSYLDGQTFADVLLGPVEYGTGSLAKVVYPTQTGVLVSSLPAEQQALVTAAIKTWVNDYDASIADSLLADYTSTDAYSKTYLAYGSPTEGTLDRDVNTTYLRIDGPRVWLELSCQAGVVVQGVTHYHTIFRDKQSDYGGSL